MTTSDLKQVKHEFVPVESQPVGPSGLSKDAPCQVCAGERYSWPHLAREITNPEAFHGKDYDDRMSENY
jgi:hypothetical protein